MGGAQSSPGSARDNRKASAGYDANTIVNTSVAASVSNKPASAPSSVIGTPVAGRRGTRVRASDLSHPFSQDAHLPSLGVSPAGSSELVFSMAGSQVLTNFQKKLLTQTWSHVSRAGGVGIGKITFQRFVAKRPGCRVLFQKAGAVQVFGPQSSSGHCGDLAEHYKMLRDLLHETVKNLNNLDEIGEMCVGYGIQHSHMAQHGLEREQWDVLGQILTESITQVDTVRKHRELMRAWTILTSFLIDKLRQGFEAGIRRPSLVGRGGDADDGTCGGNDGDDLGNGLYDDHEDDPADVTNV